MGLANIKTWLVKHDGIEAILHKSHWLSKPNDSNANESFFRCVFKLRAASCRKK